MTITAAMVKELRERTGAGMMACKKALQETDGDISAAVDVLRKAGEVKAAKRAGKIAAEGKVVIVSSTDQKKAFMLEINSETDFVARDTSFGEFANSVAQRGLAENVKELDALLSLPLEKSSEKTVDNARQELISKLGENIQLRRISLLESEGIVGSYCHGDRIGVLVAMDQADPELAKDIAMHIAASNPLAVKPEDVPSDIIAKEKEIFVAQAKESGKPEAIIEKMVTGRINKFLKEVSLMNQPFVKNPDQTVSDLLKQKNINITAFVRFEVGEGIEKETQSFADEVAAQIQGNN